MEVTYSGSEQDYESEDEEEEQSGPAVKRERLETAVGMKEMEDGFPTDSSFPGVGPRGTKPGKKTRGRIKIKMEYIDSKQRRYSMFSKRRIGMMKKAYELATLTGTQVLLLVASETGHVYTFATKKLQPMITSQTGKALIQTCLNSPDSPPHKDASSDKRMSATGFEETDLTYQVTDQEWTPDMAKKPNSRSSSKSNSKSPFASNAPRATSNSLGPAPAVSSHAPSSATNGTLLKTTPPPTSMISGGYTLMGGGGQHLQAIQVHTSHPFTNQSSSELARSSVSTGTASQVVPPVSQVPTSAVQMHYQQPSDPNAPTDETPAERRRRLARERQQRHRHRQRGVGEEGGGGIPAGAAAGRESQQLYHHRQLLTEESAEDRRRLDRERKQRQRQRQRLTQIEEEPGKHQEWSSSLVQEEPQPLQIKEEQEEEDVSSMALLDWEADYLQVPVPEEDDPQHPQIQEEQEELLQRPEDAGGSMSPLLEVKIEDDDDEGEVHGETEPVAGTSAEHMKTQAYIQYWVRSGQQTGDDRLLSSSRCSESDTEDIGDEREGPAGDQTQTSAPNIRVRKRFSCTECGKKFNHKDNLKTHMRTHTGEKPFSCTVCGKGSVNLANLKTHMRTHTGEKPFPCLVCGKSFAHTNGLKIHMMTHTGEKPFSCTVCGQGCISTSHLKRHTLTHTGEKPFLCKVCGKGFTQKGTLNTHMLTHTGEKPVSCTVCGKGCANTSSLNIHMRSHTGGNPYSCTVCEKICVSTSDLKRHMMIHESEKPDG